MFYMSLISAATKKSTAMALISETAHAKNIGNFGSLLVSIEVLGNAYKPHREELSLDNLKALYSRAKLTVQGVALALRVYVATVDSREKAWDGIDSLSNRILNLNRTFLDSEDTQKIEMLVKKIKGGIIPGENQTLATEKLKFSISLSQHSYESRLESFGQLVNMLTVDNYCKTFDEKLMDVSLRSLYHNLKSKNVSIKLAEAALNTARHNRNALLYSPNYGLVDIAKQVKHYIENSLTPASPQYSQIQATDFSHS